MCARMCLCIYLKIRRIDIIASTEIKAHERVRRIFLRAPCRRAGNDVLPRARAIVITLYR